MNIPDHFFYSQEEFFNNAVKTSYDRTYDGIVKHKYHLKEGNRGIIVIEKSGLKTELDYIYEKQNLYELIKIGDTIIKRKRTNSIAIKRNELDTIINLKFENIKGAELYSENNKYLNN